MVRATTVGGCGGRLMRWLVRWLVQATGETASGADEAAADGGRRLMQWLVHRLRRAVDEGG